MVHIHRASRKRTFADDLVQQGIDRFYVQQEIAHYACSGIEIAEFPAPDGSVELVAEVVTMTKQDYDELLSIGRGMAELYKANLDLQIEVLEAKK